MAGPVGSKVNKASGSSKKSSSFKATIRPKAAPEMMAEVESLKKGFTHVIYIVPVVSPSSHIIATVQSTQAICDSQ